MLKSLNMPPLICSAGGIPYNKPHLDDLRARLDTALEQLGRMSAMYVASQSALSSLLVEYIAGRKEGHIDSFPATARKVVADARKALSHEQLAKDQGGA